MARALRLAARGLYGASPNPRVGCVIVKDGIVVGEGFHRKAGEPHAEIHALEQAGPAARDAVVYVSLEPCSHHGRTPPCADRLAAAGVGRVVAAMQDPNPLVCGAGLRRLQDAGIAADCGLLEAQARELNPGFVSRMIRGRPWVRLKIAASLDGKTALLNGASRWITGAAARRDGHHWRARSCAVLTGIGTVRDDDPQLTVRAVETFRQPLRVVVDSRLEIAPEARVLQGGALVVTAQAEPARRAVLRERGVEVLALPNGRGKVDLAELMRELARRGINEVLAEGGARLNGALLEAGVVDELVVYLAPRLLGHRARGMADIPELRTLDKGWDLRFADVRQVGADLRLLVRLEARQAVA